MLYSNKYRPICCIPTLALAHITEALSCHKPTVSEKTIRGVADGTMEFKETEGTRTAEQVRNKGQRLIQIIQITMKNTVENILFRLAQTNQMISWQVQHRAQSAGLFLATHNLKNAAGMANFHKSPRVYPVFGTFGGTNPPLHWSSIPFLTLTRLYEWRWENNGSILCTVALAWQKEQNHEC